MRFSVSSTDLLKAILTAQKAIPAKVSEAILENYLLELEGDRLSITASDLELTVRTVVEVENAEEAGSIAVPARQLTDLLKELPDQPLTIGTIGTNAFECKWAGGQSSLPYYNPDDYPRTARTVEGAAEVTIPAATLIEGINSTVYAASDEESRPVMSSIFFDITPDSTTLVASDLQKLICYTADDIKAGAPCSFILNKRHAAVLKGIIGKDDETVSVQFDEKTAIFTFGQTTATCCLVAGKYPAYRSIIPANNSNILRINRSRLLNTVRRIAVCSPKASNHIKFELTHNSIAVSAQDLGYEIEAHETVPCSYEGDDLSIGFKSTHIADILSNLTCEDIVIKFADKRRSALIVPPEEEAADVKVFGIVMPVMVK